MVDMNLEVSDDNLQYIELIEEAQDIRDGQLFPEEYLEPLRRLWEDLSVQKCWERGSEATLPDKYVSYHASMPASTCIEVVSFLNKDNLFQKKIPHSDIKNFFPEFDDEANNVCAGRDYYRKRFARLAQKVIQKERDIYIHITTATDTAMLRVVMAAVEGMCESEMPCLTKLDHVSSTE
ncbi:hypothetical protein BC835DRAFT_1524317 [Cytidiella melzeri]|nr:hypothetical protein BC835DRAFT_1524317 [Cytidiella melzeri]